MTQEQVEYLADGSPNLVRCPDHRVVPAMVALIDEVRRDVDSIGGVGEVVCTGIPAGLGEPVFDKLKADLGKALFSLPAVLGVEYGNGFGCAELRGSENNDVFTTGAVSSVAGGVGVTGELTGGRRVVTESNRHGGMLGGISSGMPIVLHRGEAHQQSGTGTANDHQSGRINDDPYERPSRSLPAASICPDGGSDGSGGAGGPLAAVLRNPSEMSWIRCDCRRSRVFSRG